MEIVLGEKPDDLRHEIVEFWKTNRAPSRQPLGKRHRPAAATPLSLLRTGGRRRGAARFPLPLDGGGISLRGCRVRECSLPIAEEWGGGESYISSRRQ
jgi:hypothetical protein